jgi:hypothetical protein
VAEESGGRKSRDPDLPPGSDGKTLRVLARWLQDLTVEVDRALPPRPAGEAGASARSAYQARESVATTLRATAEGFEVALRHRRSDG